jgi:hypothetical protein
MNVVHGGTLLEAVSAARRAITEKEVLMVAVSLACSL